MKLMYNFLMFFLLLVFSTDTIWSQTTITRWNFNGTGATTISGGTSSPTPIVGTGSAQLVGGVTATFGSGIASGGSTDPEVTSPPNFGWNTSTYAELGLENKGRGVQFNVSTVGYVGITFKFDQRLSNSSNNSYVVQYTTNNTALPIVWIDAQTFSFTPAPTATGDVWYNSRTVNLSTITTLNNNPNVGFRVVSAFDSVSGNYRSSTSTAIYASTGTVRFDMVSVIAVSLLSVSEFENDNAFFFYPNPVIDNVIYFKDYTSVQLFDIMGKNVMNANEVKQLNIESLNSGVYFIKNPEGQIAKMVKN